MRKLVGTRPLLLCGASVVVFNEIGHILMMRRTDNDSWCFPGRAIELGEEVREAAARELLEETGLHAEQLDIFDVFSGERLYYKYPHGDEVYNVDIVFKTKQCSGELTINHESKDARFFPLDELPSQISPPVIPIVEALQKVSAEGVFN
ncbi:NUDIX hydrolase [Paenibacillus agilis]|uniref:NUDIX domain-containing protein n=1 Tax=Paenibacillus agilis TaxID=3020863 RepID=A0A559IVJ1_9BACL|nr:NUDIX domain-containing protein [Paenibacillus agilis]TVX91655.1 NUDIX domain-containing protein [Paenibacillus agilis]